MKNVLIQALKSSRPLFVGAILLLNSGCVAIAVVGVAGGAMAAHDRRTIGKLIEDENIEEKVNARIANNVQLNEKAHVAAVSFNGVLLLVGQAPSKALHQQLTSLMRTIPSVRAIHNEVRIAAPSSIMTRASDSYVTSKIKSKMLLEKNFDSTHIKVITENGEVFLMGLVTKAEGDKAITVVQSVDGVQKIINLFEYLKS